MVRHAGVVGGLMIDRVDMSETIDRIATYVEHGRSTGATHQITTINVDFVVNAWEDPSLAAILRRSDLAVADGMPVVWASRRFGTPLGERVAGADLVPELAAMCAQQGYRMMLFGSGPGVAEAAAALLRERHPGLQITGFGGPMFAAVESMDPAVLDVIREAAPDILCVALGHPKQERWIDAYRETLGVPVAVGVGASLEFLIGAKARAPRWMRCCGLEWLHRFASEPRRLGKRYAHDFRRFAPLVCTQMRTLGFRRRHHPPATVAKVGDACVIEIDGGIDLWNDPPLTDLATAIQASERVVVDLRRVKRLDQKTAAALVALADYCSRRGRPLFLGSPSARVSSQLSRLTLDQGLEIACEPGDPRSEALVSSASR